MNDNSTVVLTSMYITEYRDFNDNNVLTIKNKFNDKILCKIDVVNDDVLIDDVQKNFDEAEKLDLELDSLGIFFLNREANSDLFGNLIREEISVFSENLNVGFLDHDKHFDILSDIDYNVILPRLNTVDSRFLFKFKNLNNSSIKGSFVPFDGESIQGKTSFDLYGKGTISIRKNYENSITSWVIVEVSNLFDHVNQGKTKELSFIDHLGSLNVVHNRSYRPIVKVYVSDDQNGYSEAEVDIDHNDNLNEFTVNLEGVNSGYIRYV